MKEKDILEKIYKLGRLAVLLLALILVTLVLGVSKMYASGVSNNTKNEEYNTEYDVSMFKEIKASDIETETKGELRLVYVGRSTCSWCAAFLPNLQKAQSEYGYTTLYVDIAKIIDFSNGSVLDQDSYDIMLALTGDKYEGYMEENFGSTPMMLIIKDNKIVGAQTGYSEYEDFEKVLNESGIKK